MYRYRRLPPFASTGLLVVPGFMPLGGFAQQLGEIFVGEIGRYQERRHQPWLCRGICRGRSEIVCW
jgi:hypothetical protein